MKKGTLVVMAALALVMVLVAGVYFKRLGIRKVEIGLSNRYDAQESVVEATLFNMRTTIKNIHNCTDEFADKFIQVVAAQAKGRPGNFAEQGQAGTTGGLMALGGTGYKEAETLGITPELYIKLANAIEGHLGDFTRQQTAWVDIWQVHKTYCEDPSINEFWRVPLLAKVKEKPEMITSAETKGAMESKQMDEKLF